MTLPPSTKPLRRSTRNKLSSSGTPLIPVTAPLPPTDIHLVPILVQTMELEPLEPRVVEIENTEAGLLHFLARPVPHGTVTVKVWLTPLLARLMKARNVLNRHCNQRDVAHMRAELHAKRWADTGQGISFGVAMRRKSGELVLPDGLPVLYDGQHRLEAVITSGVAIWMHVTVGLTKAARRALDKNRRRTLLDNLSDVERPHITAEIQWGHAARMIFHGEYMRGYSLDLDDHNVFYAENEAAMTWGKQTLVGLRNPIGLAAVTGALVFAYPRDPKKVDAFATSLKTLTGLTERSPVATLMQYLSGDARKKDTDLAVIHKVLRCVYAFMEDPVLPFRVIQTSQAVVNYFIEAYPGDAILRGPVGARRRPLPSASDDVVAAPSPSDTHVVVAGHVITEESFDLWNTPSRIVQILACGVTPRYIGILATRLGMRDNPNLVAEGTGAGYRGGHYKLSRAAAWTLAKELEVHPVAGMLDWCLRNGQRLYTCA